MPRLPKGMFRRGESFYVRIRDDGGDRWLNLGRDYKNACRQLRAIRRDERTVVRMTVTDAARRWLDTYVKTARNPMGQRLAEARVERYLEPRMGQMMIGKVGTEMLWTYRLWLESQSISTQTVAHVLSDVRCLLNWCEDSSLITRSPVPRRLLPRIPERPPDRLTDEEVDALTGLPDPHGFVIRLAVGTGLRWGELCRAQASDLLDEMLVVSQTKSGKVRRVPLAPELLTEIRGHVGRLVPFSVKSNGAFTRYVRKESGIGRFHAHQLRHYADFRIMPGWRGPWRYLPEI